MNRKGAWYALGDTQLARRDKAASRLLEDDAIREQLTSRLHSTLDLEEGRGLTLTSHESGRLIPSGSG